MASEKEYVTTANTYYRFLKFCPECGKELENSPISGWLACFLHGDFTVENDFLVWSFTKNLIRREGKENA